MGYIKFDKTKLVNLEFSLSREIIRTNRAGSYTSTTIVNCNTRKYHGLLVCPVDEMGGERFVLLSSLDLTVVNNDASFNIGLRKYKGDFFNPKGHKYLDDLDIEIIPVTTYRVGSVILKEERLLVHYEEQYLVRYTIIEAGEPVRLQIRPFLAFRNIHHLAHANMYANTRVEYVNNGIKTRLYDGFPWLHMQLSNDTEFIHVPDWYYGVEYMEEQKRGYDFTEDLFTPGFFEVTVGEGDSVVFSASTSEEKPSGFKTKFTKTVKAKIPRNTFKQCLQNAAQQFVERKKDATLIIAGYPWFGAWGRDTFISLPGLALAKQKPSLYTEVLDTQVGKLRKGLFPNMGSDDNPAYNSIDAPLWFFWALQNYQKCGGDDAWTRYGEAAKSIIGHFSEGTEHTIRMRENGLIYWDEPGKALTWMDAVVYNVPVTPRPGYNVEVNALWYNAVSFAVEMANQSGDSDFTGRYGHLPQLIKKSFIELFWDERLGYLADYVNDNEGVNTYIRPNMIIAASLPYSMLSAEQMKKVLDVAEKNLLTPRGLRTLSPRNPSYKGIYTGSQEQRDSAYHQGTAWPWLTGPFCEAWLKVYGCQGVAKVESIIHSFEEVMSEHGISTVSEIYDGDPPHAAKGTISQAWSVSEILRIITILEKQYSVKRYT